MWVLQYNMWDVRSWGPAPPEYNPANWNFAAILTFVECSVNDLQTSMFYGQDPAYAMAQQMAGQAFNPWTLDLVKESVVYQLNNLTPRLQTAT